MTIPTNDPHIAPSTADHGTNGTASPSSNGASLGETTTAVQAGSTTTDASLAPVPYEPASVSYTHLTLPTILRV